jgi:shikimate 5-dehydrogenase
MSLAQMRIAVIGAGGAARAAIWALQHESAHVTLFARDCRKAEPLAGMFGVSCRALPAASFNEYDFVINATPLGSGKHVDHSPATVAELAGAGCVYDLVYNPLETKLLRAAREAGCQTLGGLEMLVAQAKVQFELWTGRLPNSSVMFDAGAAALSA